MIRPAPPLDCAIVEAVWAVSVVALAALLLVAVAGVVFLLV